METIGILHPGEMGISLAASALRGGSTVCWASDGRSEKTRLRATAHALIDAGSLAGLCRICAIIVSVCPPGAAEELAGQVIQNGFKGLYLDANAISPQRAVRIGQAMQAAGIDFVDGGIIGGPAWEPGQTWLYLSGAGAERIVDYFSHGTLETKIIGEEVGKACALKMCYAAYTKGTTALLSTILGASELLGVQAELEEQWNRDDPGFSEQAGRRAARAALKAWRFEGEMHEIASTFRGIGMPDGFHEAAAEVYRRLRSFKDAGQIPELEAILAALLKKNGAT